MWLISSTLLRIINALVATGGRKCVKRMRYLFSSVCALAIILMLSSCGGKTLIDTYIGKWEISSKDSVDEDGLSWEWILDLKTDAVFTETITVYQDSKQISVVSIDGEYGLTQTDDKSSNFRNGFCLWRRYDLTSFQVTSNDEDEKEFCEEFFYEKFYEINRDLENAEKNGKVFGLQNARVEGLELRWETAESIGFGFYKIAKARRVF